MKKGKILKTLTIFGTALCAPALLSGCGKDDDKFYITFMANGETYKVYQTTENQNIVNIPEPVKEGYTFEGWYSDENYENEIEDLSEYLLSNSKSNTTLYAKFSINQYTIVFNANGGSTIAPITQDYNTTVVKPADPTKDGYTFGGWFTDNGTFTNEYTFTTMPVDGVELYAKWNIETYTITYHLDDGTNGNNPTNYTINTNDITLEDATKEGYTFEGWYTEQSYTNKIEIIDTSALQDYNLYAKFTINQYTITFNTNEGSTIAPITQDYNTSVTKPADPTRDGYTFGGWYTDNGTFDNEYTFTTMPVDGVELYAKWNIVTYRINYYLDGGENGTNPTVYNILTDDITLKNATKSHYIFDGWYTEQEFTNKIEIIDTSLMQNYDLYAKFTLEQYTITFDSKGGSAVAPITQGYGTTVTKPTDPIKEGYEFVGWYYFGEYVFTTMPAKNITLSAKWDIITYTITYHLDGGTNGSNPETYTVGDRFTLKNPTKEGYTFEGWYTEQEFTNKIERIDRSALQNYDLYAKFTINQYTMTFDTNGGSTIEPITQDYNTSITITEPTKEGYILFGGWYTDNGTFANKYTITTMPAENITLFAQWVNIFAISGTTVTGLTGVAEQSKLTSLTIPENITEIETRAFKGNKDVQSIYIPESVVTIGSDAFSNCTNLSEINVDINNSEYSSLDGVLYNKNITTLIAYPIGKKDTEFVFMDSIDAVNEGAFLNCANIKKVKVSSLEKWCAIDFYNRDANPLVYSHELYINDTKLTNLVIPNNILRIKDYTFMGLTGLQTLTIPQGIQTIGYQAFYGCSEITSVDMSSATSLTQISGMAFGRCYKLSNITFAENSKLTSIGNYAFSDCSSLKEIKIPNSVTDLGTSSIFSSGIFSGCSSLESLTIPYVGDKNYATNQLGVSACSLGYLFSDREFEGSSLVRFVYSSSLNNYYIPTSLKTVIVTGDKLSSGAFSGCATIENVILTGNVTSISKNAFYNCSSLKQVVLPETVSSIGEYAFFNCSNLESLVIPGDVSFASYVFQGCNNISKIYCYDNVITSNSAFANATIYYYIENEQDVPNDGGNYWHYDTDGKTPIVWEVN